MARSAEIEDWSAVRRFPPGRRGWCFHALSEVLERLGATGLRELAAEGEREDDRLIALTLQFKGGQATADPTVWPREVVTQDAVVDRKVSGVQDLFRTIAGLFAGTPQGKAWDALILATFPAGAVYYTAQPYIEEAARIRVLLAELKEERWAALTGEALVQAAIGELEAAFAPYAAAIARFVAKDRVSWDEVKALDLVNHRRLCLFVARVHVDYASDATVRASLLAPIARQDQEVYEVLRAHRRLVDIDPTSGAPVEVPAPVEGEVLGGGGVEAPGMPPA